MRTVVIFNPVAGQSAMAPQEQKETADQREEKIVEGLRTYSLEPEVWYTTEEDTGGTLAKKRRQRGLISSLQLIGRFMRWRQDSLAQRVS